MSTEDNTNETENNSVSESQPENTVSANESIESAKNAANNILANLMALKESNPKVFFGGIGGLALVILLLMMSGGSDPKMPSHKNVDVAAGQSYVLKSANSYDSNAPIRMVSVPGSMAAFDETEEEDRAPCKHLTEGTQVKAVQVEKTNYGNYAKVEVTSGECNGKSGWVLTIDMQ